MKRAPNKLRLRKETLSVLESRELMRAGGGVTINCTNVTCYPTQGCTATCGCPTDAGTSRNPSCNGMCTIEN